MNTINFNIRSFLLLALCLCFFVGNAQEETILKDIQQQQVLQQYGIINQNPGTQVNQAFISQVGEANIALITQENASFSYSNIAVINQNGSFNQASIDQQGMGNEIDLKQSGDGNKAIIVTDGDLMNLVTSQFGNENTVSQDVSGSGVTYTILQYGSNNTIEQRGDEFSSGYSIIQFGNNMNITVDRQSFIK